MFSLVYVLFGLLASTRFTNVAMVRHTLMLLRGGTGSGRTFSSLWNGGTFNDPHGNMSELYLDDFKVDIDSDLGNVTELNVSCVNALGFPLAHVQFDVTSLTSSDFNDTTWLRSNVIYNFPADFTPDWLYVNETTSHLSIQLLDLNRVWVALLPGPKIVIAVNSSSTFELDNAGDLTLPAESVSELLINNTYVYSSHGQNFTDFIFADLGWTDGFIYIDRVSVEAQNQTGHRMWFTLKFLPHADWDKGLEYYVESNVDGFEMFFNTDGVPVNLTTPLLAYGIRIEYEFPVLQVTIKLFGPTASTYVEAPFLVVSGEFIPTQSSTSTEIPTSTAAAPTSTEPPSTSTEPWTSIEPPSTKPWTSTEPPSTSTESRTSIEPPTSTEAAPTSTVAPNVTSNQDYVVFLNMSILVNGSIYCPCTNVSWSTTNVTTNLAEIVANLTLDPSVLSKTTRRYTSAPDNRTSSAAMGSFVIAIIVVFLGSIVLSDVPNLLSGLKQMRRNCVYFKKKLSHERSSRCSVGTLSNTAETTLTVSSDGE